MYMCNCREGHCSVSEIENVHRLYMCIASHNYHLFVQYKATK